MTIQLFGKAENNGFYSGSVIIDSINKTMFIGHWFTSEWNNRPRTVVKVLFFSFKNNRAGCLKKGLGLSKARTVI